jgi:hypothetical protein
VADDPQVGGVPRAKRQLAPLDPRAPAVGRHQILLEVGLQEGTHQLHIVCSSDSSTTTGSTIPRLSNSWDWSSVWRFVVQERVDLADAPEVAHVVSSICIWTFRGLIDLLP